MVKTLNEETEVEIGKGEDESNQNKLREMNGVSFIILPVVWPLLLVGERGH